MFSLASSLATPSPPPSPSLLRPAALLHPRAHPPEHFLALPSAALFLLGLVSLLVAALMSLFLVPFVLGETTVDHLLARVDGTKDPSASAGGAPQAKQSSRPPRPLTSEASARRYAEARRKAPKPPTDLV